jgi:predicted DNA-binding transcriptional regulator AlpA
MTHYSTREAAKKLGIVHSTLVRYINQGKVPSPQTVTTSKSVMHLWTAEEIEKVRSLLPTLPDGRTLRYKKRKQTKKQAKKP